MSATADLSKRRGSNDDGETPAKNAKLTPSVDSIPDCLKCVACKQPWVSREPTVVKCGHIHCKDCIVKERRCVICRCKLLKKDHVRLNL